MAESSDEMIDFSIAEQILKRRFPDTTRAEIAMWCFLGEELGGLDALVVSTPVARTIYSERIFSYLVARQFSRKKIETFEPEKRWLDYDNLLARWTLKIGKMEAKIRIQGFYQDGILETVSPFTGIPEEIGLAIFFVQQVEELEQVIFQSTSVVPEVRPPIKKPVSRTAAQDAAILDEIILLKHAPLALPRADAGKRGVKAEIRECLTKDHKDIFGSLRVFNDAWQRLLNDRKIAYA